MFTSATRTALLAILLASNLASTLAVPMPRSSEVEARGHLLGEVAAALTGYEVYEHIIKPAFDKRGHGADGSGADDQDDSHDDDSHHDDSHHDDSHDDSHHDDSHHDDDHHDDDLSDAGHHDDHHATGHGHLHLLHIAPAAPAHARRGLERRGPIKHAMGRRGHDDSEADGQDDSHHDDSHQDDSHHDDSHQDDDHHDDSHLADDDHHDDHHGDNHQATGQDHLRLLHVVPARARRAFERRDYGYYYNM